MAASKAGVSFNDARFCMLPFVGGRAAAGPYTRPGVLYLSPELYRATRVVMAAKSLTYPRAPSRNTREMRGPPYVNCQNLEESYETFFISFIFPGMTEKAANENQSPRKFRGAFLLVVPASAGIPRESEDSA